MTNIMFGIVLILYLIVAIVLMYLNRQMKRRSCEAVEMAARSFDNVESLVDLLTVRDQRDKQVAKLFAGILFDLCHAPDKNVLQWKLSMLRELDLVMGLTGFENIYDDDFYMWMENSLTKLPKSAQIAQLQKIRENVKGYYIMDTEIGQNFCDMIDDIIKYNDNVNLAGENYKKTYKALLESIQSTDLELLVADMERHSKPEGTPRDNLFESLRRLRETCDRAEVITEQTDTKDKECEEDVHEPVVTSDPEEEVHGDEVPEAGTDVVQGEAPEVIEEETPQPEPVETEVPKVEVTARREDNARKGVEVVMSKKRRS